MLSSFVARRAMSMQGCLGLSYVRGSSGPAHCPRRTAGCALSCTWSSTPMPKPVIVFPGGGIFFFWQAGVASYLMDHFDLGSVAVAGASAGSLTAALLACGVDMREATEKALHLTYSNAVHERRLGLAGVWGGLVRQWMQELLPHDAAERCRDRLDIFITSVGCLRLRTERIKGYRSTSELIDTCMASVHVPMFMDGRLFADLKGKWCVDGAAFVSESEYHDLGRDPVVVVDYRSDGSMRKGAVMDFLKLNTAEQVRSMLDKGYRHASNVDKDGGFEALRPVRTREQPYMFSAY